MIWQDQIAPFPDTFTESAFHGEESLYEKKTSEIHEKGVKFEILPVQ